MAADMMADLVPTDLLDVRPAELARAQPLRGAVNIPETGLAQRQHELPPKSAALRVAATGPETDRALAWLRHRGRSATAAGDYELAPPGAETARFRLWQPSAFLAEVAAGLVPGRALDLGCGSGRDAVWLASRGWGVTGVDVLPDAIERAEDLAWRYHGGGSIRWLVRDILAADPVDLGRLDLVALIRFLPPAPLWERLSRLVCPGGSLIGEFFTPRHRARHGRPRGAASVTTAAALRENLRGWEIRICEAAQHAGAHFARIHVVVPGERAASS